MLLSGVLSGNVVNAVGAVRGAFVSMMGPMGLALAAATAVAMKLVSMWQAGKAAEAARAADQFAWSLARARENASDLANASVDSFGKALKAATGYYEEAVKDAKEQADAMQRIGRAVLALKQAKIQADPNLSAEEKIIAAAKAAAEFEAEMLGKRGEFLEQQQRLTTEAAEVARREKEAAETALAAAKAKPREAWIDTAGIARLERLKENLRLQSLSISQEAVKIPIISNNDKEEAENNKKRIEAEAKVLEIRKKIAEVESKLAEARKSETIEANRALEVGAREKMFATTSEEVEKTTAALKNANAELKQYKELETQIAELKKETSAITTTEQAAAAARKITVAAAAEEVKAARDLLRITLDQNAADRARLDNNTKLTNAEKWGERRTLILKAIEAQEEYIKNLQRQRDLAAGAGNDAATATYDTAATQGSRDLAGMNVNLAALGPDPGSYFEQLAAASTRAREALGTDAEMIADAFSTMADSIRTGMGDALGDMIVQWDFSTESINNAIWSIEQNMIRAAANMVADWIFQHTVMAAWSALFRETEIAGDATTEAEKNIIAATGAAEREGIKVAEETAKTTTHAISETAQTTATVTGATTRTSANSTEGMSWLVKAALQAMNAMASIPYVGPVLAIVAAGAIIAAGMALFSKITKRAAGGRVSGRNTLTLLNDGDDGDEFVIRGSARAKYGDAMLSQINAGDYEPSPAFAALAETPFAAAPAAQLALASAPAASGSSAATLAAALGGQPAPNITNCYFLDWAAARNDLLTSGDLRDTIKDITREFFRMNA